MLLLLLVSLRRSFYGDMVDDALFVFFFLNKNKKKKSNCNFFFSNLLKLRYHIKIEESCKDIKRCSIIYQEKDYTRSRENE
jgi:hypothetical protein